MKQIVVCDRVEPCNFLAIVAEDPPDYKLNDDSSHLCEKLGDRQDLFRRIRLKKADSPEEILSVSEFLAEVRRIVVEFVVGRVLGNDGEEVAGLDAITNYYLLHRHDFGFEKVAVGASILYAI